MPPRKNAAQTQISPMAPTRMTQPSPARSTRSTRSNRGREDDDWDQESISSTYKAPVSRSARTGALLGLKDTSVNVAAAFHAAQTGNYPTPASDTYKPPPPASKKSTTVKTKPAPLQASQNTQGARRAQSPAEQLASAARALSPVRFFLRPTDDDLSGDTTGEGAYNSFMSFGAAGSNVSHHGGNGHNGNISGNTTGGTLESSGYDYQQEDEFVKAAQAARKQKQIQHNTTMKNGTTKNGRLTKGKEDMPYRPAEDDDDDDEDRSSASESVGEGEGLVRGGALDGRAGTRGKRKPQGEGYLGMGLGLQPRRRGARRVNGDGEEDEQEEEEQVQLEDPYQPYQDCQRSHSPFPGTTATNAYRKSPTPARLLRAISPRVGDRSSPAPNPYRRNRQPSTPRTVITNLLHGVALCLRFVYDLCVSLLRHILIIPIHNAFGSTKQIIRHLKNNWWKYIAGIISLSLILRLLDRTFRTTSNYSPPSIPPNSMDELVSRLTKLEHALGSLSVTSKNLELGQGELRGTDDSLLSRFDQLDSAISGERKRSETIQKESRSGIKDLHGEVDTLKEEVESLKTRVSEQNQVASISAERAQQTMKTVQKEVQALHNRVGEVEKNVRDALDDGRLKAALERILPSDMPVRKTPHGTIDIDPLFWSELKKVLTSKSDMDESIRKALENSSTAPTNSKSQASSGIDPHQLEVWGEKIFAQKSKDGSIVSRADFVKIMEQEVGNLRELMDEVKLSSSTGKQSSSITIKTIKGDDLTPALNSLIDAALLRYSKDTIAKPDFALWSAGARVVPSITSDTLVLSKAGGIGKLVLGKKDVEGRAPATALHPDVNVGSCWPFKGTQGQLGVLLSRRAKVQDITVEHAAGELALDTSTAPRQVEVWGLVEGADNKAKVSEYMASKENDSDPSKHSSDHILLANVTYDPSLPSHIQTFPILPSAKDLDVDIGIVIFKVMSNWGADFTCLYRVRVHGEAVPR